MAEHDEDLPDRGEQLREREHEHLAGVGVFHHQRREGPRLAIREMLTAPSTCLKERPIARVVTATLTEEIQPEKLQQALDMVLPYFDVMHVRMKTGAFW